MTRLALLSCLLVACGADREVVPSGSPDVGAEAGIAADTAVDAVEETPPEKLTVEPANRTLTVDTDAPVAQKLAYRVQRDGADITFTSTFAMDDPGLGLFVANTLNINASPPFAGLGKTFVVTASQSGDRGRAKLTLVRLRTTGAVKDFLFSSPHGAAPAPDKEIFRVETAGGADVSVTLKNDPANPPGVDARKLVTVRAMAEGFPKLEPPACESGQATRDSDGDGIADTFVAPATARALCFDVRPVTNVVVTAGERASFHRVLVDVVTSSGKTLQSRSIVVMVPPTDPVPR